VRFKFIQMGRLALKHRIYQVQVRIADIAVRNSLYPRAPSLATQFTLYPRAPSLATQFTLYPRAPSPPGDSLSPGGDSPCLATQFTLLNTSLYARRQHPPAIAPALPYLRPSLGSCCRRSRVAMSTILIWSCFSTVVVFQQTCQQFAEVAEKKRTHTGIKAVDFPAANGEQAAVCEFTQRHNGC